MMNCQEATRLLSEAQERKLSLGEKVELKFHTLMCKGCRNVGEQVSSISDLMKHYARPQPPKDSDGRSGRE